MTLAAGKTIPVKDSGNFDFATQTETTTVASRGEPVGLYRRVGLAILMGTVSGTAPTLDAMLQLSVDAGTNWFDLYLEDATAQIQLKQFGVTGQSRAASWMFPMLEDHLAAGLGTNILVRVNFVIAGTAPSFTFGSKVQWTFTDPLRA